METSVSAIVLSKIRYKDNDIIVKLFTKEHGVISFIGLPIRAYLTWAPL